MNFKIGRRTERHYLLGCVKLLLLVDITLLLQNSGVCSFTTTTSFQHPKLLFDLSLHNHNNHHVKRNSQILYMQSSFARIFDISTSSATPKVLEESLAKNSNISPLLTVSRYFFKSDLAQKVKAVPKKVFCWPIASGQKQLTVIERIGKVINM